MSTIGKVFGGPPKKPSGDQAAKPVPSDRGDPKAADADTFNRNTPESGSGIRRDSEPFSAGNPAPEFTLPKQGRAGRNTPDSVAGDVIPREPLRPATAGYLKAVNEAYQPVIDVEERDGADFARHWRTVRRHKWGIFGIMLAVLVVGFLTAMTMTPIYRAQTTLLAEPFQRKVTVQDERINSAAIYLFYDTQFEIIQSRAIAERVVDDLDLVAAARAALDGVADPAAEPPGKLAVVAEAVADWFDWRSWTTDPDDTVAAIRPTDAELRAMLVTELQANTTVAGGDQSQIIHIRFEHPSASEAARRANAIAGAYVRYGADTRSRNSQRTNRWLQDQIVEVGRNLEKSEAALLAYQEQTGLVDTDKQQTLANDRLKNLATQLIMAKSRHADAQLRYQQAQRLAASETRDVESISTVLQDRNVQEIALEVRKLEREVGELRSRVTDEHPMLKQARVRLEETLQGLQREVTKVAASLRNEFEVAAAQVREIESLIQTEKTEIGDRTGAALELVRLEREVENNRKLYEALLVRLQETDVTSDLDTSNIQILDPASPPIVPFRPNKPRIILFSAILGLTLGLALAILREKLDNSIKTLDDIEEKLGLAALGIVPKVRNRKRETAETEYLLKPRTPFTEKINHIRTGLLFSSIDHPPQSVLISSSTGGEGKTTLAINLAASFSQLDSTLLLEADLRKPSIAPQLQFEQSPGLTDLIVDAGIAEYAIRPVADHANLYVLPCGTRPPNPLELLSSQQFGNVLEQLKEHFRYIVLDGPPLLAVSDAAVLGHQVDATVLAVQAEATSVKMVRDALGLMRKARVEPLGVVLTQVDARRLATYGGHHHYYYDKRYYGEAGDHGQPQR